MVIRFKVEVRHASPHAIGAGTVLGSRRPSASVTSVPVFLLLVVLAVVVAALAFARSAPGAQRSAAPRRAKRVAVVLMIGAAALLVVGFTQFRFLRQSGTAGTIVLVLDVSESMSRDDVAPTRLQAAKEAARAFLQDLPEDLAVGLVTFSGTSQVLEPPSVAHDRVVQALVGLPRGEGTVIGDGLSSAVDAVEERWRRDGEGPAAIVLLSDGRDTGSLVDPRAAAERAAAREVPVYTVVLGQDLTDEEGPDTELMADIAGTTGAETFSATTAGGLLDVYETLRDRLTTELAISDFGAWFVGAAALLAVAATIALLYALRGEMTVSSRPRRAGLDVRRSTPPRRHLARGGRRPPRPRS